MTSGKKKNHNDFIVEINEMYGMEYKIIGRYKKDKEKIFVYHNVCKNKWETTPNKLLSGRGCPICSHKTRVDKQRKTHEEFLENVFHVHGNKYGIIEKYTYSSEKILVHCNFRGEDWRIQAASLLSGCGCPNCAGTKKKTHEKFIKDLYLVHKDIYDVLGKYVASDIKILTRCNVCGNKWNVSPNTLLSGSGCPVCSANRFESKLASQIKKYLVEEYGAIAEYRELRNPITGYYLPYDIFIPNYNCYIEINGQQHYEETSKQYWGKLSKIQERDRIKRRHARKNGIYIEINIRSYDFDSAIEHIENTINKKNNLGK